MQKVRSPLARKTPGLGTLDSKECSGVLKAMADPTRIAILLLLVDGEKSVSEMVEKLGLSQPSVSHHLEILKRAGLVFKERKGKHIFSRIHPSVLSKTSKGMETIEFGCCSISLRSGGTRSGGS